MKKLTESYRPRRATAKWLEGAPEWVLAVYDKPEVLGRYTLLLGGSMLDDALLRQREVYFVSIGRGIIYWGEHPANLRETLGKKIKWADLPLEVQKKAISMVES